MPRRPASPALVVVLAAIGALLAGIAGTGSYLGVTQYLDSHRGTPTPTTSSTAPEHKPCPQFAIDGVRLFGGPGNLVTLLYADGSFPYNGETHYAEGMICQDSDGTLYYQGHNINGKDPVRPPAKDANTILVGGGHLGTVTQTGDQTWTAELTNGAKYQISCNVFANVDADGSRIDIQVETCSTVESRFQKSWPGGSATPTSTATPTT